MPGVDELVNAPVERPSAEDEHREPQARQRDYRAGVAELRAAEPDR